MAKYRKKLVVIEAVTWYGEYTSPGEWPDWFNHAMESGDLYPRIGESTLACKTIEGIMLAQYGDKIIQGVKGELYPCKPDIFSATYEEVV